MVPTGEVRPQPRLQEQQEPPPISTTDHRLTERTFFVEATRTPVDSRWCNAGASALPWHPTLELGVSTCGSCWATGAHPSILSGATGRESRPLSAVVPPAPQQSQNVAYYRSLSARQAPIKSTATPPFTSMEHASHEIDIQPEQQQWPSTTSREKGPFAKGLWPTVAAASFSNSQSFAAAPTASRRRGVTLSARERCGASISLAHTGVLLGCTTATPSSRATTVIPTDGAVDGSSGDSVSIARRAADGASCCATAGEPSSAEPQLPCAVPPSNDDGTSVPGPTSSSTTNASSTGNPRGVGTPVPGGTAPWKEVRDSNSGGDTTPGSVTAAQGSLLSSNQGTQASPCCPSQPPSVVKVIISVIFWYAPSMTITALNKYLFDNIGFTFPLFVTFIHFSAISLLLHMLYTWFPRISGYPVLTRSSYFKFIVPIAFGGAVEISFSNLAYSMVSISVMTVVKSSLVVVTYLLLVCSGLERFNAKLLGVVIFIMASISITVPGMDIRNSLGVVYLLVAVFGAAIRWVVVHHQLKNCHLSPFQLMMLTQPLSALFLAVPAFLLDVRRILSISVEPNPDFPKFATAVFLICLAVILAFLILLAEYNLVRVTSSVSLTVAGAGKEVATILMSVIGFHELLSVRTIIGILCSIVGIILYSHIRYHLSSAYKNMLGGATTTRHRPRPPLVVSIGSPTVMIPTGYSLVSVTPDTSNYTTTAATSVSQALSTPGCNGDARYGSLPDKSGSLESEEVRDVAVESPDIYYHCQPARTNTNNRVASSTRMCGPVSSPTVRHLPSPNGNSVS